MAAESLTLLDHSRRQTAEYFEEVEHLEEKRQTLEKALAEATAEKHRLHQHTTTGEKGLIEIVSEKQTASLRLLLHQAEVNSLKAKVEEIGRIRSAFILSRKDGREKHRDECSKLLQTVRSSDFRTVAQTARQQAEIVTKKIRQSEEDVKSVRAEMCAQRSNISITETALQRQKREVDNFKLEQKKLEASLKMASSLSAATASELDQLRQSEQELLGKRSALLQETARLRGQTYQGETWRL
ncbi:conserved hypothetical protein [Neospora caninum Liverpool]|uniref:Uncharacterized protein n=1 Tax=Neospora caninum (strain Liverpool) TaxID=572307 RepID=F0VCB4_NEOCL|nr:conserved hypothetical protein [Neospora caninum Liverpool]CBZ51248.1 conserved hypothetical protein [Neospora caninum Liverpool]CEL68563.1 TPA: hypothetical protein BN1204_043160 [Neospora caninum Liverpool]|eukprot:XP_003881281.1 conserved hypothetical protein [Neospora caninum Liverpool]